MILEFSVTNFRSLRDKTIFSLIAESSKSKNNNIYDTEIAKGEQLRILKSAVIYGANASGKTNLLKAFDMFLDLLLNNKVSAGEDIPFYDPFLFDQETADKPTCFKLTFIGPTDVKYEYDLEFNQKEVISENLVYFPNGSKTILFNRVTDRSESDVLHIGKLGSMFKNKEVKIFKNRLVLAWFGENEPHEFFTPLYIHFKKYTVLNVKARYRFEDLRNEINELFYKDEKFRKNLNGLITFADTKINSVSVRERSEEEIKLPSSFSENLRKRLFEENKYHVSGIHNLFKGKTLVGEQGLIFSNESKGTNLLYYLGGKILQTLQTGSILFIDELETSLHPNLAKLLIDIFHSTEYNKHGAQLVFTTHDVTLLDKSLFRKDQIWICEKDDFGNTDLYSVQDFKEVREDTPFARWYLAGKFGGLPKINYSGNNLAVDPENHG